MGAYLTVTVPSLLATISAGRLPGRHVDLSCWSTRDRAVTPLKTVSRGAKHRGTGDLHNKGSQTPRTLTAVKQQVP